jgi:hypothetical protein
LIDCIGLPKEISKQKLIPHESYIFAYIFCTNPITLVGIQTRLKKAGLGEIQGEVFELSIFGETRGDCVTEICL